MKTSRSAKACPSARFSTLAAKRSSGKQRRAALQERVRSVERGKPCVIALGGGAFLSEENFEIVSNNGVSVWLDCPFSMVERRLAGYEHRPLARDPEKLRELFAVRRAGYERADYCIRGGERRRSRDHGENPGAAAVLTQCANTLSRSFVRRWMRPILMRRFCAI